MKYIFIILFLSLSLNKFSHKFASDFRFMQNELKFANTEDMSEDDTVRSPRHIQFSLSKDGKTVLREDFVNAFSMRDMNNQQVMNVFDTADVNKSGNLDNEEWFAFYSIFVKN